MGGFELKTKRSLLARSEATRHHFGLASVIFIFFFIPFHFFRDYYVQGIVWFVSFFVVGFIRPLIYSFFITSGFGKKRKTPPCLYRTMRWMGKWAVR